MNTSKKVGIGAGIAAAAAAAAAGAYFLYGKNGTQNRKKVKGWMLKARGEVMERMEKLQNVSEDKYREIVDSVMKGYKGMKNVSPAELAMAAAEIKGHWDAIQRSFTQATRGSRRAPARKGSGARTKRSTSSRSSRGGTARSARAK